MFALIYQINFWQRKNMSDKNSSLNENLSVETKQKEVLFQNPNKLQNGLFGNEQKAAGNNLGLENKLEVSKKSGKMKYILFAVAIALFIIAGLALLNIPLQFVVIKEIFSVIIIGSSGLFGVLSYIFYKNIDTKESALQNIVNEQTVEKPIDKNAKLEIQSEINKLDIISENKPKNITQNQIIMEKPKNVIEQINDIQVISNKTEIDKSKEGAGKQIIMIQNDTKTPELTMQSGISKLDIISENKPKDITQNQIIVEKSEQENTVEQINSLQILGEKTNKKEIGGQKIIIQNDDNASNYDIENGKLDELLEQLKDNGLTVIYDSENREWKIERPENKIQEVDDMFIQAEERPENVFEQIDEIEILAKERPENIEESIDEIEITAKERPENVFEQIDEIEISAKERPENITEQIEEIQINELDVKERNDLEVEQVEDSFVIEAKERPENKVESIDEIEITAKERPENITEQIDEIEINAKERPENVFEQIDEIQIAAQDITKREDLQNKSIDEIEITAKEREENVFEKIDEIEILAEERPENVVEQIDSIEIIHVPKLEKEKNKKDQDLNEIK